MIYLAGRYVKSILRYALQKKPLELKVPEVFGHRY